MYKKRTAIIVSCLVASSCYLMSHKSDITVEKFSIGAVYFVKQTVGFDSAGKEITKTIGEISGDCTIGPNNMLSKPVEVKYDPTGMGNWSENTLYLGQDSAATIAPVGLIPFSTLCAEDGVPLPADKINYRRIFREAGFDLKQAVL